MAIPVFTTYNPISKALSFKVGQAFNISTVFTGIDGRTITTEWYKDGVLITTGGRWTMTKGGGGVGGGFGTDGLYNSAAISSDAGSYKVRAYNTAPDTGYIDSDNFTATLLATRLTQIAAEIKTMIEGMTIAGGYYNNWGDCNILDAALRKNWPHAFISYQLQQPGTDLSHYYGMLNAEFTIEVEPKIVPSGTVNSVLDSDAYMDTVLADLVRLFLTNTDYSYLPLSGEAVMSFKEATRQNLRNGDVFRPGKLITKWNVHYHNS
jgi:hypothetical protein